MLLTVTTTRAPATDLGYLLHKHPARVQSFPQSTGVAHVFYPEATESRCTAALLLEVDPVGLVRGRRGIGKDGFALAQYVNDRPYAASSMLALALKDVFGTALTGRCDARPELAAGPLPLEIRVPSLPCRGGAEIARAVFEPLGWTVDTEAVPLDATRPDWGDSRYVDLRLRGNVRLAEALRQLYVLLPVLDDAKHYWVSTDEIDKLVRAGDGWLATHPQRAMITRRYLAHRRELTATALARLAEIDDVTPDALDNAVDNALDSAVDNALDSAVDSAVASAVEDAEPAERPVPLALQRRGAVLAAVRACGAASVGDLGCGEGTLVRDLLGEPTVARIVAADVSARALDLAARRLRLDRPDSPLRERVQLIQSSLTYRDDRLVGLDAAVLMEVVEHLDPPRLPALESTVFGHAAPRTVIVTTPNREHNVRYETLAPGAMRHRDHRFEWTRAQFADWTRRVGETYGYTVRLVPVGADDAEVGPPTQMAVFTAVGR